MKFDLEYLGVISIQMVFKAMGPDTIIMEISVDGEKRTKD